MIKKSSLLNNTIENTEQKWIKFRKKKVSKIKREASYKNNNI